jgi:DUF4097 and DUF4098 domain-containing protein YvlB
MSEHTFQTPEPVELEIRIPAGDIEVETIDGDQTFIEVTGHDRLVEQTEVEQRGRRIVVEHRAKVSFGVSIGFGSKLRVRARVPHGSEVELATAAADMALAGRFAAVGAKSASGDLVVRGEIEGDARIKTVSGDVDLPGVGGSLELQTVSGDASAASVGGDVTAKSVSGDVRVELVREGKVSVQSVSGDIRVGVAAGTNLDVDAGSVSGDLTSEVPLGSEPGAIGDGPVLVVRGKTVSGDFKVFRAA